MHWTQTEEGKKKMRLAQKRAWKKRWAEEANEVKKARVEAKLASARTEAKIGYHIRAIVVTADGEIRLVDNRAASIPDVIAKTVEAFTGPEKVSELRIERNVKDGK